MKKPRIYVDTSVFGGRFDDEFMAATRRLLDALAGGSWIAIVSDLTMAEVARGPSNVGRLVAGLPEGRIEKALTDGESERLADAYVKAGVVAVSSIPDALHVAIATCARADLVASWNFRHLANWAKVRAFSSVNLRLGYPAIEIRSPLEITFDEN